MAQTTRSKEWFYKQCVLECDQNGPLSDLSWRALLIGIGQIHKTRGHMTQAIGAVQDFLRDRPHHPATIQQASPAAALDLTDPTYAALLQDWRQWLAGQTGDNPGAFDHDFGYNFDTLRGYLTHPLGGTRVGGGGGDDELKLVMRLMADFLNRT